MSKTVKIKGQPDAPVEPVQETVTMTQADVGTVPKALVPRSRGPRGTTEDAVITLISQANPKRPGSKAFDIFSTYRDGMTIKEFADSVEARHKGMSTVALVYDAKHGFVSITGYDPGAIVAPKPRVAKPKKEKAPYNARMGGRQNGDRR